jgi:hypothetical protein
VDLVIAGPFCVRQSRLEKTFRTKPIRGNRLFVFSREENAHFFRVRAEDANDQVVADTMRPQNSEWIGMGASEENV